MSYNSFSQHVVCGSAEKCTPKSTLFYLFIFGRVGSSLLQVSFLQLRRAGATLRCGARASPCGGFSCREVQALGAQASVPVAHRLSSCGSRALEHRLSSCGARAQLLHSMWDLPGPRLEPVSPALAGGSLTTAPPGKSQINFRTEVRMGQTST